MSASNEALSPGENVFGFAPRAAPGTDSPTASRILLGTSLRLLRGKATLKEVTARTSGFSVSKLSRFETGNNPVTLKDVRALLRTYKAAPEVVGEFEQLARHAMQPEWTAPYRDLLPRFVERLIALESKAWKLYGYERVLFPGLLQTEAYARAVITGDLPGSMDSEVERRVALRMQRQHRARDGGVRTVHYIDEGVLTRTVGSPEVMVGQLERLIALTQTPGFGIRVIPRTCTVASSITSITHLDFRTTGLPELVYNEGLMAADYLVPVDDEDAQSKGPSPFTYAKEMLWRLMGHALDRVESQRMLLTAAGEYLGQL
ncbi:helix-turn-helix domain-containing protein [Kitasatospora sp. NPDC056076]|uniref:helix-turn-helix domain-containing protein n=1 Tax=Kitasatospora sp. NPDC056076 TaxID=3345703 RepID=UPI0035E16CED